VGYKETEAQAREMTGQTVYYHSLRTIGKYVYEGKE